MVWLVIKLLIQLLKSQIKDKKPQNTSETEIRRKRYIFPEESSKLLMN